MKSEELRRMCLEFAYISHQLRWLQSTGKGFLAEATAHKARKEQLRSIAGAHKLTHPKSACGHDMTILEIKAELEEVK